MYNRKTMSKEEIVKVLAGNYRLTQGTGRESHARWCSIICYELVGLRICMSCRGNEVHVFNPDTTCTEYRFNSDTGEEIK